MTYALLNAAFLAVAAVTLTAARKRRGRRPQVLPLVVTAAALVVMTAVFDNIMIAAGLFDYAADRRSGLGIGRAPVEDFAYPVAGALLLPALWELLRPRTAGADAARSMPGPADPAGTGPATGPGRAPAGAAEAGTASGLGQQPAGTQGSGGGVRRAAARAADLLAASRPLSWVNTAYPFAAAYLMAHREVDARLVVGTIFFLVPYNLLMYGINDVFDYESDRKNPRKGGVEGALLDQGLHRLTLWVAALLPVPFVGYLLVVGDPVSWSVLGLSLFAVVAYSAPVLRFKERPGLDSLTSSTHFVSPALYGLVLAGHGVSAPAWLVLAGFFLWGAASQAFGAVQDIGADRQAGIASVATALGARTTVRLALAGYTAAGLLMLLVPWPGPLAAALALPYLAMVWPFRGVQDSDAATANRGWRRFLWLNYLVGFLVTLLLIWSWRS